MEESNDKKSESLPLAIVTGGTRGIGYGIASILLEENFRVIVCSRKKHRPETLTFPTNPQNETFVSCDISNSLDRKNLVDFCIQKFGRIDLLVNNAGIAPTKREDLLQASEDSFEQVLKVNLQGPYFLTQEVAKFMINCKQERQFSNFIGMIINIGSISAFTSSPFRGEYCISKAGMAMMTQLYADRLAQYDIPVFEIQPGIIKTEMTAPVEEKYNKRIAEGLLPLARWGYPKDIGKVVKALVNGLIPYSTGQVFHIDGGFHLRRL